MSGPSPPPTEDSDMSRLLLPPVNRAMRTLDRAFFKKTIPISAARIFDQRNIARIQKDCAQDVLRMRTLKVLRDDPGSIEQKLLLLRPEIKHDDLSTAGPATQEFARSKMIELIPYSLQLNYENWSHDEIINAILPEDILDGAPTGYAQIGHIAHMNLRAQYTPYKKLIGEVLLDKTSAHIRSVVNKIDDVGTDSVYRTFPMELLAGDEDTEVDMRHVGCDFRFDFAKVYWNTRLDTEHGLLVDIFQPGEAVADVMAGVGPFALPAAKKGVLTFANDLNPACYEALVATTQRNKLSHLISAHNEDGATFIKNSIRGLYKISRSPTSRTIPIPLTTAEIRKYRRLQLEQPEARIAMEQKHFSVPPTFSHFVMNLPATAVTFLGAFVGSFRGLEHLFEGLSARQLPMIHVYIFAHPENNPNADICARISKYLGYEMKEEDVEIFAVRSVAPQKFYYRVSFRLPAEVAFSDSPPPKDEDEEERARRREKEEMWIKWAREN